MPFFGKTIDFPKNSLIPKVVALFFGVAFTILPLLLLVCVIWEGRLCSAVWKVLIWALTAGVLVTVLPIGVQTVIFVVKDIMAREKS